MAILDTIAASDLYVELFGWAIIIVAGLIPWAWQALQAIFGAIPFRRENDG